MTSLGYQRPLASVLGIDIVLQACVLSVARLDCGDSAVKEGVPADKKSTYSLHFNCGPLELITNLYFICHHLNKEIFLNM